MPQKTVEIEGQPLALTNLDKIFWINKKITKGQVIEYYLSISSYILPYLKDRPQSLHRFPNGITGERFYQKNLLEHPKWLKTIEIPSDDRIVNHALCQNLASLIFLANLGCIEMNSWNSRVDALGYPDYAVIDLDPENVSYEAVLQTALAVKEICDQLDISCFAKTSGARGLHILIPLPPHRYTHDQAKSFSALIANLVQRKLPHLTSLERLPKNRQNLVYLDFLQNGFGKTLASAYSLRPVADASVSVPVTWEEIAFGFKPSDFNIFNVKDRLLKKGDLFSGFLNQPNDLSRVLSNLKLKQVLG